MKKNDIKTEEQFNDLAGMCMGWRMGEDLWWYDPTTDNCKMFHRDNWNPINDWNQAMMIFDKGCSQLFSMRRVFLNDLEELMRKYNDNTIISHPDGTNVISYPDALMYFTPYNIRRVYPYVKYFQRYNMNTLYSTSGRARWERLENIILKRGKTSGLNLGGQREKLLPQLFQPLLDFCYILHLGTLKQC